MDLFSSVQEWLLRLNSGNDIYNRFNRSNLLQLRYKNHRMSPFVAILGWVDYNPGGVEAVHDPTFHLLTGYSTY